VYKESLVKDESAFNAAAGTAQVTLSVDGIKSWLVSEIGELLSVDARDLSVYEPLGNYGLSSMTGVILSGNIEEWLGLKLDPVVAWDYPTIELLAGYLAEEVKSQRLAACI
jgi:acyl carrier protein